jgi:glycine/D-amino acid oxidase-like deaminating enzyme
LKTKSLLEEKIDLTRLKLKDGSVEYKKLKSRRIIFCEGHRMVQNPLWKDLPLLPAKGEILTIECKGLPEEFILMSGIFIIPLEKSLFRVGSTYEWNFTDELPTQEGKEKLQKELDKFLKIPYAIIDHRSGVRPTVKDRRPLIGRHKDHENVFIFNGMGTKGVVLVPYFADHFIKFLYGKEKLMPEVDVQRFKK